MGKTRSAKAYILKINVFLMVSISVFTILYGLITIYKDDKTFQKEMTNEVNTFSDTIKSDLDSLFDFNRITIYNDTDISLISFDDVQDHQRVVSLYNIRRIFQSHTQPYNISLLYDTSKESVLYTFGKQIPITQFEKNSYAEGLAADICVESDSRQVWHLNNYGGRPCLYSVEKLRSLYLCTAVDLYAYMEYCRASHDPGLGSLILFDEEEILYQSDHLTVPDFTDICRAAGEERGFTRTNTHIICSRPLFDTHLCVALVTPLSTITSKLMLQVVFFLVVLLMVNLVLFLSFRFLMKTLLFPLHEIAAISQHLERADFDTASQTELEYDEFCEIREALIRLLNLKECLEQAKIEKEHAAQHAMLQYYQLQTRSHFFLNCLKSLYSMAGQYNAGNMQMMISAFSAHLRYVFHDTLSLITLSAELKEVSDYHKIISQDYPRPFILDVNAPSELGNCKVPTLIIQTFLENTYKYNGNSGSTLVFRVDISKVDSDEKSFLRIHIADNGIGYSTEVIATLNMEPEGEFDRFNVGINNLKRRMKILYGGDYQIAFCNAPGSGAVTILYLPCETDQMETLGQEDRREADS